MVFSQLFVFLSIYIFQQAAIYHSLILSFLSKHPTSIFNMGVTAPFVNYFKRFMSQDKFTPKSYSQLGMLYQQCMFEIDLITSRVPRDNAGQDLHCWLKRQKKFVTRLMNLARFKENLHLEGRDLVHCMKV